MDCTDILAEDHALMRESLDTLLVMVQTMENGERIEIADAMAVVKFLRLFGEAYHQTTQENVLFPALLRAAPQENRFGDMRAEHALVRAVVSGLENALMGRKGPDFVRCARRLNLMLRDHLEKEDRLVRELAGRALSPEEDRAIAAEFTKNRIRQEMRTTFRALAGKYAPRARVRSVGSEGSRTRSAALHR